MKAVTVMRILSGKHSCVINSKFPSKARRHFCDQSPNTHEKETEEIPIALHYKQKT